MEFFVTMKILISFLKTNLIISQNIVVYFKGVTFISVLIKLRLTCIYWQYTVAVHGCHIAW